MLRLSLFCFGLFCACSLFSKELVIKKRENVFQAQGRFVTVDLDRYANSKLGVKFPSKRILVKGVPFELVNAGASDNLFLQSAGWKNVKKDPSSYYSPYDILPKKSAPNRFLFNVPVVDYAGIWLLAATDDDASLSDVVSVRIGAMAAHALFNQVRYCDYETKVPRFNSPAKGNFIKTDKGNLFLVYIPIKQSIAQKFAGQLSLIVDVTKKLRLAIRQPDPCRYQIRPLGLPSGVHLFGMTFVVSPVQMRVGSVEPGGVFVYPQRPSFDVSVDFKLRREYSYRNRELELEALATDYYGNTTKTVKKIDVSNDVINGSGFKSRLSVDTGNFGFYDLRINLKYRKQVLSSYKTTFAYLPEDTRRHRESGFLGTWDFIKSHYTPYAPDLIGSLYYKAGIRYGMFSYTENQRHKYGVVKGNDPKLRKFDEKNKNKLIENMKNPLGSKLNRFLIFHETCISGSHITRIPDLFSGRPPYVFDKKEKEKFATLWKTAEENAEFIRKVSPETEVYFGNGAPLLFEAFLKNKFPAEKLGSRGNEAGSYMRSPETQPPDWIANNSGLWMDRTLLDHYGYKDTPLRQCYEMCYPGTNPGNLSLRTQANYFIRHIMHSLAWKIPVIRPGIIVDSGSSYYFSNWGSAGLCFAKPEISPKPSYVAFATLTRILDGAVFERIIENDSPSVYALEFKRKDGSFVNCLWTLRGERNLVLTMGKGKKGVVVSTDIMGNENVLKCVAGKLALKIGYQPIYLTTASPIASIQPGKVIMRGKPKGKSFIVSPLNNMADWSLEKGRSKELEMYDFMCPRRKGNFEYSGVEAFDGKKGLIKIAPKTPVAGSAYLPMYSVLKHAKGVEIPGEPTRIGLMVNGNGGWGRFIFELEDAAGQRWISIGAEQSGKPTRWMADWMSKEEFESVKTSNTADWNTDDSRGESVVNFEGWRYLSFPLPGNYPGEKYHWPRNSQWRCVGDGVVKYPLKFKKLIITMPEKILKLTKYAPVKRKEIYVKDLMVTYETPEKAFKAE